MAQKRRARSTTIASGGRNAPRACRKAALVKRKRETSEPPIARASNRPLLDPSEIESRQKREKRPDAAVADVEHRRGPGARLTVGKDAQVHLAGGKAGMVPTVALREAGLFPAVVEAQVGDLQQEVGRVPVRRVGGNSVMHSELDAAA